MVQAIQVLRFHLLELEKVSVLNVLFMFYLRREYISTGPPAAEPKRVLKGKYHLTLSDDIHSIIRGLGIDSESR